jgi:Na+-transporting NADH:ubiquinone oxidoreductase subunit NqrC
MSAALKSIQEQAKKLNKEEKFELASFLWQDLHEIDPEVKAYWQEEMKKRAARFDAGETRYIRLEDFRKKYAHLEEDHSQ